MAERKIPAGAVFAMLCIVAAVAIAAAVGWAKLRLGAPELGTTSVLEVPTLSGSNGPSSPARVYFRYNGLGPHYGKLAHIDYREGAPAVAFIDELACESVYVAAGRGICLSADRGVVTSYAAKLFDTAAFEITGSISLVGVPSRTRVSADGRLGATTDFVTGHGYDSVDFSTQTLLLNLPEGDVVADLETFRVVENGGEISNPDFNFWGVTFTPDSRHFYATLSTSGRHVLVRGNMADRAVEVVHENVECPSLSPDGTRVAYKRRFTTDGRIGWHLQVLELATRRETPIAERRSVDDQLEWLDDHHVLYAVASGDGASAATDIWVTRADGTGAPRMFLKNAYSPAVVR